MEQAMQERLLVTAEDAAASLGIGRSTVYELMAAGELRRVKIGRRTLVTVESVREYVNRLTLVADEAQHRVGA